ncbi:TPA: toll/interleukin-1 receptor domain-containing protein [Klebsiella pneumoniae]|uniref:toll/interleukin-1 receptor domain-containing protein n=1 Tax=Klebsiella pneumoniae TaxID=573 RepID=UPI001911DDC7|nr:toll/interleukin-1 receptor domain-containing protein [Klebsiella pneumoniae]MBK5821264.1 toll/interleukin-1 receptor domain-containing protein [Klebsiella pneumoniae]HBQ0449047.1 toll/interleukin-1 receptor domain-containing protein [Klebsiella pneumoniae]HBW8238928.1 toll/interleukin-1 receptor domain-containing protein [Klebsiella pneumoniae]
MESPKVFVSHASEDKERFVMAFAERLRANGVDAWVDKWEIKVGDSLVRKIFSEGLAECSAIIVILSSYSVNKPWVKEELDHAVVKKISEGTRIIPIVIDSCDVPAALKSTKWVNVKDFDSYDETFDEVISTIFGATNKPPLGKPPAFVSSFVSSTNVGGHNAIDSFVTKLICEKALEIGSPHVGERAFVKDGQLVLPREQLQDSLEYLYEHGTIDWRKDLSGSFHGVGISEAGFELYARDHVEGYSETSKSVISLIVNSELRTNVEIHAVLNVNIFIINHILRVLNNSGKIKVTWFLGGNCMITTVSSSLKRSLM